MQPREPETGTPPQPLPQPAVAGGPGRVRSRRARLVVAVVAGVLGLLCLGGVGVAVALYDSATEIKRSEPDAVVAEFLIAYLVRRNDNDANEYLCDPHPDLVQLSEFRTSLQQNESKYSAGMAVRWRELTVQVSGKDGSAVFVMVWGFSDGSEEVEDKWKIRLVERNGWRVCGATRES